MSKIYEALLRAELDRGELAPGEPQREETDSADNGPLAADRDGLQSVDAQAAVAAQQNAFADLLTTPPALDAVTPATVTWEVPASSRRNRAFSVDSASPITSSVAERMPASDATSPAAMEVLAVSTATEEDGSSVMPPMQRHPWNPMLASLPSLQARGAAAEQFRSLRSRLAEFRASNTLKSVLVSSGMPQEGKSFVAMNLALSLTRNSKVLLIDGDLRRSSLHQMLGTTHQPGLADYLAGKAGAFEVMQQAELPLPDAATTRISPLASLTFIAGGVSEDSVEDLSASPRFQALMQTVSPHFDWIVVDSSPINLVADAANLALACDGVLLVVRSGITQFMTAQRARDEFKASPILGVVLNASSEATARGNYYGAYGYGEA